MRKMLAAFDGLKFSASTLDYAIWIAKDNNAHLVGLFLRDLAYHSYKIYDLVTEEGGGIDTRRKNLDKKDEKKREASILKFEKACRSAGISYSFHKDRRIAIQEILRESLYADLVIIDRTETLSHYSEELPTHFIRDMLPETQCPVMLVPNTFKPVNKLVLLFDGEPSSVYAIKMLSYAMGALKRYPAEVVTVNPIKQKTGKPRLPNSKLMKEFMQRHFPNAVFTALKGFPETEIVNYLKEQKGIPLVVLGAYRRSRVSRWFRASMADVLMRELKFPLFIAHS